MDKVVLRAFGMVLVFVGIVLFCVPRFGADVPIFKSDLLAPVLGSIFFLAGAIVLAWLYAKK
jgi:hypothetical protein